jgi:pentatricopeptide repeat protein
MLGSFAQAQRQHFQASLQRTLPCKHLFSRSAPNRHRVTAPAVVTTAASNPPHSSNTNTASETQKTIAYVSDQTSPRNPQKRRHWNKPDVEEKQQNKLDRGKDVIPEELVAIIDNLTKYKGDKDKLLSYMQSVPRSNSLLDRFRDPDQLRVLAVELAESSAPYRAMRLIDIASTLGTNLKQNTYEGVAHQYALKREWLLILPLVAMGLRWTGRTTARLLNWRTRALIETSRFGLLDGVLEQFRDAGLKPNARTFQLLVTGHLRNKDLTKARSCITLMEEYGFEMDGSTRALIASAYRQLGPDQEVQRTALESLRDLSDKQATAVLNSLIQLSLDAQDTSTALHYLSLFDDPQSVVVGKSPRHQPPLDGSSLSHSFRPDSATFTILIKHFTNENRQDLLNKISSLIGKMKTLEVSPDSAIAAAVVRALCAAGDVHSALEIVARVCQPTAKFEAIVDQILCFGRVPKVVRLDKDHLSFISRRAELDVRLFNAAINGLSGSLGINAVRAILRLMHTNKVKPDNSTIEAIVSWLNKTELSHPRTLVRTLKKLLSTTHRPNSSLSHTVVASLIRRERTWVANDTATPLPPPPNPRTDPSPASGPLPILTGEDVPQKLGYRGMTRFLVQSLLTNRVQSNRFTFAQRMKRAAMCGDVAATKSYFRAMLKRGMHPTAYHYAALMEAHINAGMADQAETVLHSAMHSGSKPNVRLFTILIAGYGRQRKPNSARRVFEEMVRRGVEPDLVAVHAVSSAYYKAGLLGLARAFLVENWKSIAPVPFYRSLETVPFVDLAKSHRRLHEKKPIWSKRRGARDGRGNKARRMIFRWKMKRVWDAWKRADTPRQRLRKRWRGRSPEGG